MDWLTEVRDDRPVVAEFDQESYSSGVPARLLVQVADRNGQPVDGASVEASLTIEGETARVRAVLEKGAVGHGVSRRVRRGPVQGVSPAPWGPVAHDATPHGHGSSVYQHNLRCAPTAGVPGRYEAAIATDQPGELTATVTVRVNGKRLGSDEAKADVEPAVTELLASRPSPELLSAIAEASGGRAVRAEQANGLAEIAAVKATVVERPSRRLPTRLPTREPWVLIALVILWTLDWGLRRRRLLR